MTLYRRSPRWAAVLALGLACLIGVGATTVPAAPARTAASAFELTLDARDTMRWDDELNFESRTEGTFRSRAPFCATGTVEAGSVPTLDGRWPLLFTCDDGTGSLTVSDVQVSSGQAAWENTTWRILDGSGSYADLRGRGPLRRELLGREISDLESVTTWRGSYQGTVDRDAVEPTVNFSSATATKLRRPAGAYTLKLRLALRDDVTEHPVSYTLRVTTVHRANQLAQKVGTATTGSAAMTLRIHPPSGLRTVRVALTGADPAGNEVSVRRAVSLPR